MSEPKEEVKEPPEEIPPELPVLFEFAMNINGISSAIWIYGLWVIVRGGELLKIGTWFSLSRHEDLYMGVGIILCGFMLISIPSFLIRVGRSPKMAFSEEIEKKSTPLLWPFIVILIFSYIVVWCSNQVNEVHQFRLSLLLCGVSLINFFCWLLIRYYKKYLGDYV